MHFSLSGLKADSHPIKAFFFRAQLAVGWASKQPAIMQDGNVFVIKFEEELFRFVDKFEVDPETGFIKGETLIFYSDHPVPVWYMKYHGHYGEEYLPLLKAVLFSEYDARIFTGGRGPERPINGDGDAFYYRNFVDQSSTFNKFSGAEYIWRLDAKPDSGGWHHYHGGLGF